ncbi:MAG TPA: hypothetical protein VK014_08645 [Cyclobacteriaceae bacterium]|nr:hypothetical protein [Cyclobacteriaceae bacterium]
MPANKKYLTKSPLQRFAKISAGLVGGYLVTVSLHLALAAWIDPINVLITLRFGGFILWVALLIVAFLARNGWKVWAAYLTISLIFSFAFYISKTYLPLL